MLLHRRQNLRRIKRIPTNIVPEESNHHISKSLQTFSKNVCRTLVPVVGPLVSLFWTSGDICPWFQSQGGSSHFALLPACNGFLRFTFSATFAISR